MKKRSGPFCQTLPEEGGEHIIKTTIIHKNKLNNCNYSKTECKNCSNEVARKWLKKATHPENESHILFICTLQHFFIVARTLWVFYSQCSWLRSVSNQRALYDKSRVLMWRCTTARWWIPVLLHWVFSVQRPHRLSTCVCVMKEGFATTMQLSIRCVLHSEQPAGEPGMWWKVLTEAVEEFSPPSFNTINGNAVRVGQIAT